MAMATDSASAQAIGMNHMHGKHMTKQAMANAGRRDKIHPDVDFDKAFLKSINDADGVCTVLHAYGNTVLVLLLKRAKSNDDSVTYDMQDAGKDTETGEVLFDVQEARAWADSEGGTSQPGKKNLLCIAWSSREMKKLAKAFPQSISIDATHKTVNIDNMYHLTVTTKDSFGKTIVVLRLWIPNQQKWIFRYVMLVVIPQMFGRRFCDQVKAIVTDGDPHLISIIDLSIQRIFKSAKRKQCCWHIVDRPLNTTKYRSKFHTKPGVSLYFV